MLSPVNSITLLSPPPAELDSEKTGSQTQVDAVDSSTGQVEWLEETEEQLSQLGRWGLSVFYIV